MALRLFKDYGVFRQTSIPRAKAKHRSVLSQSRQVEPVEPRIYDGAFPRRGYDVT